MAETIVLTDEFVKIVHEEVQQCFLNITKRIHQVKMFQGTNECSTCANKMLNLNWALQTEPDSSCNNGPTDSDCSASESEEACSSHTAVTVATNEVPALEPQDVRGPLPKNLADFLKKKNRALREYTAFPSPENREIMKAYTREAKQRVRKFREEEKKRQEKRRNTQETCG